MGKVVVQFGHGRDVMRVVGVVVVCFCRGVFFGGSAYHGGGLEVWVAWCAAGVEMVLVFEGGDVGWGWRCAELD